MGGLKEEEEVEMLLHVLSGVNLRRKKGKKKRESRGTFVHGWLSTSRSITLRSSYKFNEHASRMDSSGKRAAVFFLSSWPELGN